MAEYDLATAEAMLQTERLLYVGFMCHQVVEKVLKAYYVSKLQTTPPYIHNLSRLANLSGLYEKMDEDQKSFLDTLEPLNIEARYPTHKEMVLESLTVTKCEELISKTKELAEWINNQL
ncbi:MAG: HEPN domain-containing protein [Firmicutes bacterium]|nr:HEPN domain-containing protein [Bacillota bacterium]